MKFAGVSEERTASIFMVKINKARSKAGQRNFTIQDSYVGFEGLTTMTMENTVLAFGLHLANCFLQLHFDPEN
jgi:hypothetical protein